MSPDKKLYQFARDIIIGEDITLNDGLRLARQLEVFLLDAGLGLEAAFVYFMEKPGEPKALRIRLHRTKE